MKRIFSLLMILFICIFSSFAQEDTESDDGFGDNIYVYDSNGRQISEKMYGADGNLTRNDIIEYDLNE